MEGAPQPTSFYTVYYSKQPKLLLVEDDPTHADTLTDILTEAGFTVSHAPAAASALALMANDSFDLCLVDWRLPDIPGHQLIGEMKMVYPSCPCILFTGYPSTDTAALAINSGADGYIAKPIDPEFLLSLLEGTLFRRLLLQERERFQGVLQTLRTFRHEIGNPLQGLLGNIELLSRRLPPDPNVMKYITNIRTSADQILSLMDRLDELKHLTLRDTPVGPMLDLPPQRPVQPAS